MAKRRKYGQFNGAAYYAPGFRARGSAASRTVASIGRIGGTAGFAPDAMYTVLRYSATYAMAATPGNRVVMRGNSCFDPGFTSGSDQPVGYDQWSAIYSYQRVLWSKIHISYVGRTSATDTVQVSVYPCLTSNPFATLTGNNNAQAYGKSKLYLAGSDGAVELYGYMTSKKIFGDRSDNDAVYQSVGMQER